MGDRKEARRHAQACSHIHTHAHTHTHARTHTHTNAHKHEPHTHTHNTTHNIHTHTCDARPGALLAEEVGREASLPSLGLKLPAPAWREREGERERVRVCLCVCLCVRVGLYDRLDPRGGCLALSRSSRLVPIAPPLFPPPLQSTRSASQQLTYATPHTHARLSQCFLLSDLTQSILAARPSLPRSCPTRSSLEKGATHPNQCWCWCCGLGVCGL